MALIPLPISSLSEHAPKRFSDSYPFAGGDPFGTYRHTYRHLVNGGLTGLTGGGSTNLDGWTTVGEDVNQLYHVISGSSLMSYVLAAGTDAQSLPDVLRPLDYAASTNEKVFRRLKPYGVVTTEGISAAGYIAALTPSEFVNRSMLGTAGQVTVTNGDGSSGDTVFSLPTAISGVNSFTSQAANNLAFATGTGSSLNISFTPGTSGAVQHVFGANTFGVDNGGPGTTPRLVSNNALQLTSSGLYSVTLQGGGSGASLEVGSGANGAVIVTPAGSGSFTVGSAANGVVLYPAGLSTFAATTTAPVDDNYHFIQVSPVITSAGSSTDIRALSIDSELAGSTSAAGNRALRLRALTSSSSSANLTILQGISSSQTHQGSGLVALMSGYQASMNLWGTGNATLVEYFRANVPNFISSGIIAGATKGLAIYDIGSAGSTGVYGAWVDDLTKPGSGSAYGYWTQITAGAGGKWAFYAAGTAPSYFGGSISGGGTFDFALSANSIQAWSIQNTSTGASAATRLSLVAGVSSGSIQLYGSGHSTPNVLQSASPGDHTWLVGGVERMRLSNTTLAFGTAGYAGDALISANADSGYASLFRFRRANTDRWTIGNSSADLLSFTPTAFSANPALTITSTGVVRAASSALVVSGSTPPATGEGVEIQHDGTRGSIFAYDRDISATQELRLNYPGGDVSIGAASTVTTINGTATSTSTTTGALVVKGGVGVDGNLVQSGYTRWTGNSTLPGQASIGKSATYGLNLYAATGSSYDFALFNAAGASLLLNNVGSTNLITGGALFIGGVSYHPDGSTAAPSIVFTADTNTGFARAATDTLEAVAGGVRSALFSGTTVTINPSTVSSTSSNGALVVNGGVGIGGNLNIGGTLGSTDVSGRVRITSGGFASYGSLSLGASYPAMGGGFQASYDSPTTRIFYGDGSGFDLRFATRASSTTTDRITFSDSGGITATDSITVLKSESSTLGFTVTNASTGASAAARLLLGAGTSSGSVVLYGSGTGSPGVLGFSATGSYSWTITPFEKMTLDSTKLAVTGNITASGTIASSGVASIGNLTAAAGTGLQVITSTSTDTTQYGMFVSSTASSAATSSGVGIYARARFSDTGTYSTTSAVAVMADEVVRGLNQTLTNNYGVLISARAAGTNRYGLYVHNVSGGTLNYSVYTNNGQVRIGGIAEYADNAAAVSAGLAVGVLYRTGDALKIVN